MTPIIEFKNVSKKFDQKIVIDQLDLSINKGEIFVLVGPSGSGKTTTLKMINALSEPTDGDIYFKEKRIKEYNIQKMRWQMGYVLQQIALFPTMDVKQNIEVIPEMLGWSKKDRSEAVDRLLTQVKLDPEQYRHRMPKELSGGEQQRIGILRALAANPEIILMDEPFSALDPISREQLQDEVLRLQQALHKTIVFVTHDIDEAIKMGDKICIMNQGEIVQFDTPERVLRHPANEFVSSFIGTKRMSQLESLPSIEEVIIRPVTAKPNRGLAEAINTMRRQKVDTLIIVDKNNVFLGIAGAWEIQQHFQQEKMTLEDVMRKDIPVLLATQSLSEAIHLISKHQVAYLPVINDRQELLGIVNRASLVDIMARQVRIEENSNGGRGAVC